jgi:hypothetical protein
MRSHTGGAMSLGRGVVYGTSKKHKLNTKSSTESEIVAADDVLPQMLWTLYFLEAQGYKIDDNVLYQDNKSSILLETNGRGSSGKRTRHINVRYFFIADRVKSKEVRIEYCPTGIMLADYFTKPQQGLLFRQMRDMIMGNIDIALPTDKTVSTTDQSNGIPVGTAPLESRSVLRNKDVTDVLTDRPSTPTTTNDEHSSELKNTSDRLSSQAEKAPIEHRNDVVAQKRTISWAQIARKGIRQ